MEVGLKVMWSTASAIGLRRLMTMLPSAYKSTTFFFDGDACKGHVGLTIDDGLCRNGPGPSMVAEVAALLSEHEARCTFFVCSEYLIGVEDEAEALVAEGHELGNHMTSDKQFFFHKLSAADFDTQVGEVTKVIESVPGVGRVRWFRAPQAILTKSMARSVTAQGLRHALGDCYADDWAMEHNAEFVAKTILKQVKDGSVIVLHQPERGFREHTFAILRQVLEGLQRKGLKCITLSEMATMEGQPLPASDEAPANAAAVAAPASLPPPPPQPPPQPPQPPPPPPCGFVSHAEWAPATPFVTYADDTSAGTASSHWPQSSQAVLAEAPAVRNDHFS